MGIDNAPETSAADAERARLQAALVQKRRAYNRRYMRRWRSAPGRKSEERKHRQQSQYARKVRASREGARNDRICGFCGVKEPITKVARLQVSEIAPDGYVMVRIPYCGEC